MVVEIPFDRPLQDVGASHCRFHPVLETSKFGNNLATSQKYTQHFKEKKGNGIWVKPASFDDVILVRVLTVTLIVLCTGLKELCSWLDSVPFHPLLFFLVFLRHDSGSCVSVTGLPDPFAKVVVDGSGQCHSTDTVKSTLDPKWNQHYDLWVQNNQHWHIYVYIWNLLDIWTIYPSMSQWEVTGGFDTLCCMHTSMYS